MLYLRVAVFVCLSFSVNAFDFLLFYAYLIMNSKDPKKNDIMTFHEWLMVIFIQFVIICGLFLYWHTSPLLSSCGFHFQLAILYYERSSFGCTSIDVPEVWVTYLKERKFFQIPVIVSNSNSQHIKSWFRHITKRADCYGHDSKLHMTYISRLSWNVLVFLLFRAVLHIYIWSVSTQWHPRSRRFFSFSFTL